MFNLIEIPDYLKNLLRRHNVTLLPDRAELIVYPKRPDLLLYPGAHIATGNEGEPYHHGIVTDTSDDMNIIHFWGEDKKNAKIQTTTLNAFLAGHPDQIGKRTRPLYLIEYPDDNDEKRRDTVRNAKDLLTKADQYMYNVLSSNCEALACFCRTGQWTSQQVERITKLLAIEINDTMQSWIRTSGIQNPTFSANNIHTQDFKQTVIKKGFGSLSGTINEF